MADVPTRPASHSTPTELAGQRPGRVGSRDLEPYRPYLAMLARAQVDPALGTRLDLSGVIQQTFLEAHQKLGEFRGDLPEQVAAWLRQILAHNLADALKRAGAAKRDVARQRSLEQVMARGKCNLTSAN